MSDDDPGTADTAIVGGARRRGAGAGLPREVGRYRLTARLGAGGMGQVFRAHDPQLNREVAIKLLHPTRDGTAPGHDLEVRLLREAQAMAKLSHPNLAVVHDVGSDRGEVFLAMELIDGETLKAWLTRPRPWRARLDALIAAGRGLAAAHSAGVIHRDFKPDNVLVARDGAVKVVDFGLARGVGEVVAPTIAHRHADVLQSPVTMTGTIMGTPAYMAPEQHEGEAADERADQFAFAVSVYEALYGRRPFTGDGMVPAARAALGEIPVPARSDVPAALFGVVRRGLAPAPADRHPSMAAMIDALAAAARPPRRRWPALVAALALVGLGALVYALVEDDPVAGRRWSRRDRAELAAASVQQVVDAHVRDLWICNHTARRDTTFVATVRIAIAFSVGDDGRVRSARISDQEPPRPQLAACVAAAVLTWTFPAGAAGSATHAFTFEPQPAIEVEPTGDGGYRVSRGQLEAWIADPWPLALVRLTPSRVDGAAAGLKLFAIASGSPAAALGFENGDTLIAIDELAIRDEAGARAQLETIRARLRGAPGFTVTVRRRGEVVVLRYQLVDALPSGQP